MYSKYGFKDLQDQRVTLGTKGWEIKLNNRQWRTDKVKEAFSVPTGSEFVWISGGR